MMFIFRLLDFIRWATHLMQKTKRHGPRSRRDVLPHRAFGTWRRFDRPTSPQPQPPRP
jgi:hypothetical protein